MIELTTKVQDQPRGTTAQTVAMNPTPQLAKTIHEQLLAAVLLDAGDKRDGLYMVTTRIEVSMYIKSFDQPFVDGNATPASIHLPANVETLEISYRAQNCLAIGGIRTIGELVGKTELDLLCIRGLGRTSLREIKRSLQILGLSLKSEARA